MPLKRICFAAFLAVTCIVLTACRLQAPAPAPTPSLAPVAAPAASATPNPPTPAKTSTVTVPTFTMPDIETSGNLDLEGGSLYYEVYGSGPVVVLLHDGLLDRRAWDFQVAPLAKNNRVIRYDRRGFGSSSIPTQPYSDVEDLYRLLTYLQVEQISLVGASSGSLLAIDFTLAHPAMVETLFLVGPVVSGLNESTHFRARNAANRTVEDWWDDPYLIAPGDEAAHALLRERLPELPSAQAIARYRKVEPEALRRLNEISVPVIILVGDADIPEVHAQAGAIQAGIWNAQRAIVEHAGHLIYLEQTEVFNRALLNFLRDRRKP